MNLKAIGTTETWVNPYKKTQKAINNVLKAKLHKNNGIVLINDAERIFNTKNQTILGSFFRKCSDDQYEWKFCKEDKLKLGLKRMLTPSAKNLRDILDFYNRSVLQSLQTTFLTYKSTKSDDFIRLKIFVRPVVRYHEIGSCIYNYNASDKEVAFFLHVFSGENTDNPKLCRLRLRYGREIDDTLHKRIDEKIDQKNELGDLFNAKNYTQCVENIVCDMERIYEEYLNEIYASSARHP